MIYVWLPSAELAVSRVAKRVSTGGHHVPEETVQRRYERGLKNFFQLYQPIADDWSFYDNSNSPHFNLIASGSGKTEQPLYPPVWQMLKEKYAKEK